MQVDDDVLLERSLDKDLRNSITNYNYNYDADLYYPTDMLNSLIPEIKENIRKTTGKNAHRKLDTEELIVELIKRMIEIAIKTHDLKISINWQSFQWDNYKLLTKTWDIYFKDLELNGRAKLQKNDWVDLLNLAYVMPDMKYWTFENKWRKIFDRDKILRNYTFG